MNRSQNTLTLNKLYDNIVVSLNGDYISSHKSHIHHRVSVQKRVDLAEHYARLAIKIDPFNHEVCYTNSIIIALAVTVSLLSALKLFSITVEFLSSGTLRNVVRSFSLVMASFFLLESKRSRLC